MSWQEDTIQKVVGLNPKSQLGLPRGEENFVGPLPAVRVLAAFDGWKKISPG